MNILCRDLASNIAYRCSAGRLLKTIKVKEYSRPISFRVFYFAPCGCCKQPAPKILESAYHNLQIQYSGYYLQRVTCLKKHVVFPYNLPDFTNQLPIVVTFKYYSCNACESILCPICDGASDVCFDCKNMV